MNGEKLNVIIKQAVMDTLKGGEKNYTPRVAVNIDTSIKGEVFVIDSINLADSECKFEQLDRQKPPHSKIIYI